MDEIRFVKYEGKAAANTAALVEALGVAAGARVSRFHSSMPCYQETPLTALPCLAEKLGLAGIYIKDESKRFGLNAFKALGASYAMTEALSTRVGEQSLSFQELKSPKVQEKLKDLTFITVTDGNHGRGVAWMARQLGCKAIVMMPAGTVQERVDNIAKEGAEVTISPWNYDETVRHVRKLAQENGYLLMQDTAWEGYEDIPLHIMQGYTSMAREAFAQLAETNKFPTHVFLQAGVGSMAGAVTGYIADYCRSCHKQLPKIVIVEPTLADCCYRTAAANDGNLHFVTGAMNSMMAGLCCGEPCTLGWSLLQAYASGFMAIADPVAAEGMRQLARPLGKDAPIVSGESGAAGFSALLAIMTRNDMLEIKQALELDETSTVLCFSTEGDTDKENYRKIVALD